MPSRYDPHRACVSTYLTKLTRSILLNLVSSQQHLGSPHEQLTSTGTEIEMGRSAETDTDTDDEAVLTRPAVEVVRRREASPPVLVPVEGIELERAKLTAGKVTLEVEGVSWSAPATATLEQLVELVKGLAA